MKKILKVIISLWPWPLTLNERYDRQTAAVIKKVCSLDSVCIDIGCFKGVILQKMIRTSPLGRHIAFEPVPSQFQFLKNTFGHQADVFPYALGNETKSTTFNWVTSNPTYSGLQQRQYKGVENIEKIMVEVRKLDDVINPDIQVRLIKIDVEGGEFDVLKGSESLLKKWKPYLIFEHGIGGADVYGVSPGELYTYLVAEHGYAICLMSDFLKHKRKEGFTKQDFEKQFWEGLNCYFLAVPPTG